MNMSEFPLTNSMHWSTSAATDSGPRMCTRMPVTGRVVRSFSGFMAARYVLVGELTVSSPHELSILFDEGSEPRRVEEVGIVLAIVDRARTVDRVLELEGDAGVRETTVRTPHIRRD